MDGKTHTQMQTLTQATTLAETHTRTYMKPSVKTPTGTQADRHSHTQYTKVQEDANIHDCSLRHTNTQF